MSELNLSARFFIDFIFCMFYNYINNKLECIIGNVELIIFLVMIYKNS